MEEIKINPKTCYTSYAEAEQEIEDDNPPIPEKLYNKIKSKGYESLREYAFYEHGVIMP